MATGFSFYQAGPRQVCSGEVSAPEVGVAEVGLAEVNILEVQPPQGLAPKVDADEVAIALVVAALQLLSG